MTRISSLPPVTSHVEIKVSSDPAGAVPVRPTHVSSSAAVNVPSLSFRLIVTVSALDVSAPSAHCFASAISSGMSFGIYTPISISSDQLKSPK